MQRPDGAKGHKGGRLGGHVADAEGVSTGVDRMRLGLGRQRSLDFTINVNGDH